MREAIGFFLFFIFNIILINPISAFSQSKWVDELANSPYPIKSINPSDEDFSDLEPLGKSIGEASIVFIGEQEHGDGGAIMAKNRLVKYLHLKKGFDVLAFEADFYACVTGWENLNDSKKVQDFAANNIYGFWSKSKVSEPLWRFVAERRDSIRPLIIAGVDVRQVGEISKTELPEKLKNKLNEITPAFTKTYRFQMFDSMIREMLNKEVLAKISKTDLPIFYEISNEVLKIISESKLADKDFWEHEMQNLIGFAKYTFEGANRDKYMAQNLSWLVRKKFPGKKIIVWAHNNHNALDVMMYASINPSFAKRWFDGGTYEYFTYLGASAYREFGEKVYSLGFLSYEGTHSPKFFLGDGTTNGDYETTEPIKPAGADTLEGKLVQKGLQFAFVPLPEKSQGSPTKYPWFATRAWHYTYEKEMDYVSSYNGFIFIKTTFGLNGK